MNNVVKVHYAAPGLYDRIVDGLKAIGKSPASVDVDDLANVDEFHLRGPGATRELIEILDVGADSHVLDVGSGLGGPARRLAKATGCRVTGVDLSEDYCAVGNELTKWVGLSDLVRLEPGDATKLDHFAPSSFDAAWSIHVGMNVQDKSLFYSSVANVLKSGAPLVLFDILSTGTVVEPHYPVPWAATPEQSFLVNVDEMSAHLERADFSIIGINDQTTEAIAFLDQTIDRTKSGGPPPLGLHLVIGPDTNEIIARMRRNLVEGSLSPTVFYARKN